MAIVVYTGKPGSGKTYRVVSELLADEGRYYVFHNIDGLKESLIESGKYIQSWTGIDGFFTKRKQEEISDWARKEYDRAVLVIIDECQVVLGDRNAEIKAWLSWHRHLGQDIKLICQHYKMIQGDYYNLADYEIRGKRGYITKQFVYQWTVNGEAFKTDRLKKSKAVFAAYRSFVGSEVNKGGSKILLFALGVAVFAIVSGVYVIGWGLPTAFEAAGGKKVSRPDARMVGKEKNGSVQVPVKPAKPPDVVGDRLAWVSYAGIIGHRVTVQDIMSLSYYPLDDICSYKVLSADGRSATVFIKGKGIIELRVKTARYLAAAKHQGSAAPVPPDGASAGK